jgi:hypothetical protein
MSDDAAASEWQPHPHTSLFQGARRLSPMMLIADSIRGSFDRFLGRPLGLPDAPLTNRVANQLLAACRTVQERGGVEEDSHE